MKIRTEFQEDSYNIYTEEVEQGFCEPCFFIQCLSQSEKDKLSERFLAQHSFVISYFPKKGNAECWQVQKKTAIFIILYYVGRRLFIKRNKQKRKYHRRSITIFCQL